MTLARKGRGQDDELGVGVSWAMVMDAVGRHRGLKGWRAGPVLVSARQAACGPAAVGAVVLLDEHSCSATLLKPLLLIVASELALDQDGRLGHLLVECKL